MLCDKIIIIICYTTYIRDHYIQQFCPLPARLNSWCMLVWMNGRLASNIGLCSLPRQASTVSPAFLDFSCQINISRLVLCCCRTWLQYRPNMSVYNCVLFLWGLDGDKCLLCSFTGPAGSQVLCGWLVMYHDIAFVFTGSLTGPVYVGFLTEPTLCFAYVGSLTGPTLAFCSMADSVTKFGLFRKSQQYILAAVTPSAASIRCIFHRDCNMVSCTSQAVGYHGVKFIHCILCLESIKHRYTFSLNLLWCKAVSSANNEIQSCRSQQFFGCSNLVASIRCILQKFALLHSRKKLDTMERQILLWCSNLGHFFMSVAKLSLARVSSFCSRCPH